MTTLNVHVGGSIQAAIDAASSGDTIDVQAGTYNDQFLSVEKSVTWRNCRACGRQNSARLRAERV